jgi:hypothetical protein
MNVRFSKLLAIAVTSLTGGVLAAAAPASAHAANWIPPEGIWPF